MLDRLKLFRSDRPYEMVLFDHNPEQFKVTRQTKNSGRAVQAAQRSPEVPAAPGTTTTDTFNPANGVQPTQLVVSKARLVGPEVKIAVGLLLSWVNKAEGWLAKVPPDDVANTQAPVLLAQWGPPMVGFTFYCKMQRVDVTFLRVSAAGIPTHAVVNLTLSEEPSSIPFTNPTSGGRPGRNRHMVTSDESLASIATQRFGQPGAWRAIADINDIDDPTAIRPGDMLYLPGHDEVRERVGSR
jgi:nucleoid-associated protein YgaU